MTIEPDEDIWLCNQGHVDFGHSGRDSKCQRCKSGVVGPWGPDELAKRMVAHHFLMCAIEDGELEFRVTKRGLGSPLLRDLNSFAGQDAPDE